MRFLLFLPILLFSLFFTVVASTADTRLEDRISKKEALEDLKNVYDLLVKFQPNLYAHRTPNEFKKAYQKIRSEIPEKPTKLDVLFGASALSGLVCDEHTSVRLKEPFTASKRKQWPYFGYRLHVDGDALFVSHPIWKEARKVKRINALPANDIAEFVKTHARFDGCYENGPLPVTSLGPGMLNLLTHFFGVRSMAYLVFEGKDGNDDEHKKVPLVSMRALGYSYHNSADEVETRSQMERAGFKNPDIKKFPDQNKLKYRYSFDGNLAFVRLDSFILEDKETKMMHSVMRDVIKKKPNALILDLTRNSGGSLLEAQNLAAYLLPKSHRLWDKIMIANTSVKRPETFEFYDKEYRDIWRKNMRNIRKLKRSGRNRIISQKKRSFGFPDYKGNLYVLVSPKTRSAATAIASYMKLNRNAKIVGFMAASNVRTGCFRAEGTYTLKNSGILIDVPTICTSISAKEIEKNSALAIDHEIDFEPFNPRFMHSEILKKALNELEVPTFGYFKN